MTFKSGKSGNAYGGSLAIEIRQAARREAEGCISVLAVIRDDERVPPKVRANAAKQILGAGGIGCHYQKKRDMARELAGSPDRG